MMDVLIYLRAERILEMTKVKSFVTGAPVNFERRTDIPSPARSEEKADTGNNKSNSVASIVKRGAETCANNAQSGGSK